jgi:predicted DCC family thiol-disulfide oxidoreductase YuxK
MTAATPPTSRAEPWVLFDGDCGFCTSSAGWVARCLARPGHADVRLVPWQRTDLLALGTTSARAQQEVLWVAPDGTVSGGASAVAAWLRYSGQPWATVGKMMDLRGVRSVAARAYRFLAEHRATLPGGTPACALPASTDE